MYGASLTKTAFAYMVLQLVDEEKIGEKYDKIANWWNERHLNSNYGVGQISKALDFASLTDGRGTALDVGCGAGGRLIQKFEEHNFHITDLDTSKKMIVIVQSNCPQGEFINDDIINWTSQEKFDFILAWGCLIHLPLKAQN